MNAKILHWKPVLDKIEWTDGISIHIRRNESLGYTDDSPCTHCDDSSHRFWEMGFFNPDDASDKGKYFIIVNRRCFPEIDTGDGDLRQLKIKFNSLQLSGFKNWKIMELDSNKVIRTFDKDSNIYVNMGELQPGEGKLYKIAPVMQEGGTLVTDEECVGEFDCKGEVNYDIILKPATTLTQQTHPTQHTQLTQ